MEGVQVLIFALMNIASIIDKTVSAVISAFLLSVLNFYLISTATYVRLCFRVRLRSLSISHHLVFGDPMLG